MGKKLPPQPQVADTWDTHGVRFVVEPVGNKFRVLVESRIGRTLIGGRLVKSQPNDTSYPDLDYDFDNLPDAERRAKEWTEYVKRSWPRRDK